MKTVALAKVTALVVAATTPVRVVEKGDRLGGMGDCNIVGFCLLFIVGLGKRHPSKIFGQSKLAEERHLGSMTDDFLFSCVLSR